MSGYFSDGYWAEYLHDEYWPDYGEVVVVWYKYYTTRFHSTVDLNAKFYSTADYTTRFRTTAEFSTEFY